MKYIPDTIISGGAKGADTYAKEFANKHNQCHRDRPLTSGLSILTAYSITVFGKEK